MEDGSFGLCNTSRLDGAGGETKEGWVIDRWLGDYKMAYTTPAPHQCPIIHLCFGIFVSKEIPRQEIDNQSFGQSMPLEVNVCPLHIVSTAALSLPPRTRSGALTNTLHQATNGKPPRVFQFVIFVWISAARFVPVKITGAGARSKLGTM